MHCSATGCGASCPLAPLRYSAVYWGRGAADWRAGMVLQHVAGRGYMQQLVRRSVGYGGQGTVHSRTRQRGAHLVHACGRVEVKHQRGCPCYVRRRHGRARHGHGSASDAGGGDRVPGCKHVDARASVREPSHSISAVNCAHRHHVAVAGFRVGAKLGGAAGVAQRLSGDAWSSRARSIKLRAWGG